MPQRINDAKGNIRLTNRGRWRHARVPRVRDWVLGVMNILYPKIRLALLPTMFGYAALGGLLGGIYGMIHDQVTYSLSHEYFTRFKFSQFHYANFGLSPGIFVAEIGFLASWWVGFFAAWLIARLTVPAFPRPVAFRHTFRGFAIVFAAALLGSFAGYFFGLRHHADYSAWQDFTSTLGVVDVPSFVRVAYIHNASYLGGLTGLVVALIYVRRLKYTKPHSECSGAAPCCTA